MHFSSIPALVDAHLLSLLAGSPLKGASLFLFVASKDPLVLEDSGKVRAIASEDDLEAYLQSYDRIEQGTTVLLDNLSLTLDFARGHCLDKIDISSKRVMADVESGKERELRNFELKVTVGRVDGELPLAVSSYGYLRRMERQELVKKHYKPSKTDPIVFARKQTRESSESSLNALDSESIALLRGLLPFTDKEELFRVLLRKPLKERESKKAVRLSIIPTDVEEGDEFEIRKKGFTRQTILQLLSEYEARDAQLQ
jgi:hypothetical protein